uniref:RING-type domain-containing protein n=1 Tax=Electrophorus electricus TaxID=8005 RepID=A0A4W4F0W4_ELEEL
MENQQRREDCAVDHGFVSSSASDVEDESVHISQDALKCHCCYEVMVDPTTLNCGHSFCRHCIALWLQASHTMECPGCCEFFQNFPKINISLRDLVEMHFSDDVTRIVHSLQAFQAHPRNASCRAIPLPVRWHPWLGVGGFFTGILITLPFVTVSYEPVLTHLHCRDSEAQLLVKKPLLEWTVRDLAIWMEDLGPWTFSYRGIFLKEQVNGRYGTNMLHSGAF